MRKKENKRKKNCKKKIPKKNSELEEILDEEKLKELSEEINEEDSEIQSDGNLSGFIDLEESTAPVLEQIAGSQQLGRIFFSTGRDTNSDDEREIKYAGSEYKSSEKNYEIEKSEELQETPARPSEHFEVSRKRTEELKGELPANQELRELRMQKKEDYFVTAERTSENKKLPFEREKERKYKL
jgi:hypothetical protein